MTRAPAGAALEFIRYADGPLAGQDTAVRCLPPVVTWDDQTRYAPTGETTDRGQHIYALLTVTP